MASSLADSQRQEKEVSKAVAAIQHWLPRFDVMVIGPGLGRDAWVHATVTEVCSAGQCAPQMHLTLARCARCY